MTMKRFFSKWRLSAILDFGNSDFLTVWVVKRPILHNCAKFRKDRSNYCCDIAIFVVFQDSDRRYLVFFEKCKILMVCVQ